MTSDDGIKIRDGRPLAFEVMGGWFHLDAMNAEMEPLLHAATSLLAGWYGEHLRWSTSSFQMDARPFREADLEYVGSYASNLSWVESSQGLEPLWTANLAKLGRDDYYLRAWSGETAEHPGRYGIRFRSEIAPVDPAVALLPAKAVLDFCVPIATPLDEFVARTLSVARLLPIRWGAAGFTYSFETRSRTRDGADAIYEHSRRYHGFDVGYRIKSCNRFFNEIRGVNWLTFIGPELASRADLKCCVMPSGTEVVELGSHGSLVIKAGDAPARADVNRLAIPPTYADADRLVRAVRSRDGDALLPSFPGPWSASTVAAWLQRFEKRVTR